MSEFGVFIDYVVNVFKIEFVLFGFSVSFWQALLFILVFAIVVYFVGGIIKN